MTFWRTCSGILRSDNFILWIAFKMGKHPENTADCMCGCIVGCTLKMWQCAFFMFCWCSQQTVSFCLETRDIVISSLQNSIFERLEVFWTFNGFLFYRSKKSIRCAWDALLENYLSSKLFLWIRYLGYHLSSLLSRDINRKDPWGSTEQLNFNFHLSSFKVSLGLQKLRGWGKRDASDTKR